MLNIERLNYIIKDLQQEKAVYVKELAQKHFVSGSTIRRDLNQLESDGFLHRTYGGAVISDFNNSPKPFVIRKTENHVVKDSIASLAASLVRDDMYIGLDPSTTVLHMVKYIRLINNLRIITTSAQITLNCLEQLKAQVFCTGGWMNPYSWGCIGETARQSILNFNTDIVFFSAKAISMENGITDCSDEESIIRQWMLEKCKKAVLLCDSSKFDQKSFRHVCDIDQIDCLVTEKKPDEHWMSILNDANVEVMYPGAK